MLLYEFVRVCTADAGVFLAELLPCQLELSYNRVSRTCFRQKRLRGRAFVGDYGERLLAAHPGAGIDPFSWCVHKRSGLPPIGA